MSEKKILVVDDDEKIREILQQLLTEAGYTVILSVNAGEALDVLKKQNIMVMFLDLNLVGEMNGIDLCKKIRKENQIGVIYALTGYTDLFSILECRIAGFDDLFIKPANVETILKAAHDAFNKIERWKIDDYIVL